MTGREWALVAFTLLMQTSVGILLVVSALHPLVSRNPAHTTVRAFDGPLLVAAAAAALGLIASLGHLGQPLHAWLAITNVRTSWLSREIMLSLMFAAAVVVLAGLNRAGSAPAPPVRAILTVLAIAPGVTAVYVMSRLYMIPAQPAWNRVGTPLAFFTTALVLGTLVVVVMAGPGLKAGAHQTGNALGPAVRALVLVAIGCLAVQLLLLPGQIGAVAGEPAAAISTASAGHLAAWLAFARVVFAVAAGVLLALTLRAVPPLFPADMASVALLLACLSEVLGRLLFYASSVRL